MDYNTELYNKNVLTSVSEQSLLKISSYKSKTYTAYEITDFTIIWVVNHKVLKETMYDILTGYIQKYKKEQTELDSE